MSSVASWGWPALFLLGAYHGINPGMGWLFAVALGMQEKSSKAVLRALAPITLGHAFAVGLAILLAALIQVVLPLSYVQIVVAAALTGLGVFRLVRRRHFAWGGMQVGFLDLTFWSFLMASAHGAGLMVLPVVVRLSPEGHHNHGATGVAATLLHTLGYLVVTAAVAFLVYRRFGLSLLRRAWINLDLIWAIALILTGCLALLA